MVYINFFHGRTDPKEELEDWGKPGPIVGPCQISFTYGTIEIHKDWNEDSITLPQVEDMIHINQMYYGDFEIMAQLRPQDKKRLISFDQFKELINNFGSQLFKGKYYSLWSKKEKSFEHYPNGYPVLKSRHSKVIFENNAVLTGWYYDDMILQPVYEFLDWKLRPDYNTYMDFETLMNDCFKELEKAIEEEVQATTSDANIIEEIKDRDIQFTIEGKFIE